MHPETQQFIDSLFAPFLQDNQLAFLTFTAIHPDGSHPTPSRHVPIGNAQMLERAVERLHSANKQGWGAYLGIAPRVRDLGRWSRGTRRDLVALPAVFIDVDSPHDLAFRLMRFDLPPSCVVSSGKGYHVYWFLKTPARDFAAADDLLRRLAHHFGSDEKMTVAQSMRLPGTSNTKPDRQDALCQIAMFHPEWRYTFAELAAKLPPPPQRSYRHREPFTERRGAQADHDLVDTVTERVIEQLEGFQKANGWIAARCPCPHCRDRPGMHFSYHPETGTGYCFGKHGKLSLAEMCDLLGITHPVRVDTDVQWDREHH
jgi:hypothetical protein